MTDADFGAAMKTGKDKRPANRHYFMILVIILILALAISIILTNYYSKSILEGDGTSPPSFPDTIVAGGEEAPPSLPDETGGTPSLPMESDIPLLPGFE